MAMNLEEALWAAVKAKDANRVDQVLSQAPELANLPGLVLSAAYAGALNVLDVIVARHPVLDIFEAAVAGDAARIRHLAAADPGLVQAVNGDGFMPLHLAAHYGRVDALKALIEQGADVSATMPSQVPFVPANTALHAAIAGGPHKEVIRHLVDAGADVNKPDSLGATPLHSAAFHNDTELVALLLERGGTVNTRMHGEKTPLGVALASGNAAVANLLRQHGGVE